MKHSLRTIGIILSLCALSVAAHAQGVRLASDGAQGYISRISNNGLWGVMQKMGTVEGSITPGGGVVYDLRTMKSTDISHSSGLSGVSDISDDGQIIVGEAQARPAFYSMADKKWHILPLPAKSFGGRLECVTPDGRYAAGFTVARATSQDQDFDSYIPVMYDLTTETIVEIPGMPTLDMQHENHNMTTVNDISPDGRYLIGRVSQSYLMPPGLFSYVYDRETATYTPIGFTESLTSDWTPDVAGTNFCDFPCLSPNGEWVIGSAWRVEALPGSEWPNEYSCAYRYHIPTGKYESFHNGNSEQNVDGVSILNDGTMTIASPSSTPYADAYVRSGNYYISLKQILKQVYGIDFEKKTGWSNTGKLVCAADDGKTFITMVGPQNYYLIELPDPLSEAAAKVDLLEDYTITPAAGTVMSKLKTFEVRFDRDIVVNKAATSITFATDDNADSYTALKAEVTEDATTTLKVTFRTRQLNGDTDYVLTIPAGMVSVKGDTDYKSKEIKISYKGREDKPMTLQRAYPADGAEVSFIDLTDNPVTLTFDTSLAPGEEPLALLYRDDETDPIALLNLGLQDNKLVIYPTTRQNLYKGTNYKMVLKAGSVTDVTGGCANEEITLNWVGQYVRTIETSDRYIFQDTSDSYENFMFYDGDRRTPVSTIAEWGFTAAVPWLIVRSSTDVVDMAFASHSMYTVPGTSDDWMVTPQLFIPDENCYLTFDAQSYKFDKDDVLEVYVYESSTVYNSLREDIIEDIVKNGKLIFKEKLSPGTSEEGLEGNWQNQVIRLDDYVGKEIYIAFANRNNDQSAIFLDNICVARDLHYLVSLENATRVVNADEINVRGSITVASDIERFETAELTLRDANGTEISKVSETGLDLGKDDVYNFLFPEALPLEVGKVNTFSVEVKLNETSTIVNGTVKNLTFEPYKRIVVEEYSGRDCGNCPQGFVAMENLEKLFPGRVIPVVIRTYQGDPLGQTVQSYSAYLGMERVGAPTGRLNRGDILSPMVQIDGDYTFSAASIGDRVWFDEFNLLMAEPSEAGIDLSTTYDATKRQVAVNTKVRNAINATGTSINLFAVLLEDKVDAGYQSNYFNNIDDSDLGDWGKGGKYSASYVVPFSIDNVARSTWGQTFQGTGGLIPSTLEAGKEYVNTLDVKLPDVIEKPENCRIVVMLIDANTGRILNANYCSIIDGNSDAGIEEVFAEDINNVAIVAANGIIAANGAKALAAYSINGQRLGYVEGSGLLNIDLSGYHGVVIVRAVGTNNAVRTAKFMLK